MTPSEKRSLGYLKILIDVYAEDRLERLQQIGSVANYISLFNEYAAQVDWNEGSLMARCRKGLKDKILDSVATAKSQPHKLQEWMAMASKIDEWL